MTSEGTKKIVVKCSGGDRIEREYTILLCFHSDVARLQMEEDPSRTEVCLPKMIARNFKEAKSMDAKG
jgi:hypothetical protein